VITSKTPEEEYQEKVEHWKSLPIYQWGANKIEKAKNLPPNQNPKKPQPVKSQEIINFVKATTEKAHQTPPVVSIPVPSVSQAKIAQKILIQKEIETFLPINLKFLNDLWKNHSKMFLNVNDKIRYKCEVLSEIKLEPVVSDLREGVITSIQKHQITVNRTDSSALQNEDESPEDVLYLHNFYDLSISEKSLTPERKKQINEYNDCLTKEKEELEKVLQEKKKKLQENLEKEKQNADNQTCNPEEITLRMVGNQVF
jgi:hypothetical protein